MRFSTISLACLLGGAWAADSICDAECQKGCDTACQAAIQATYDSESKLWVGNITDDTFYSTPANMTGAKPGDILRWQTVPYEQLSRNWTIPAGLTFKRFMYVTEDINGDPLPATAWVLLPFSKSLKTPGEPGKLRTIVWTHGTAGRSRLCSTTNNRGLYYDWKAPFILAESGYAVIAPDYSGQGSDIPQGFMYESGYLHVADVAYALLASRKAIGDQLSDKWMVYGHSEGGMTAWRTAERLALTGQEALNKAGKFIGAIAAAPALRPQKLIPLSWSSGNGGGPFSVYFLQSLAGLFPDEIKVEDHLTEVGLQRLNVLDNSCFQTGFAAVGTLTPDELFKTRTWLTQNVTNEWAVKYNGQGPHPLAAPMLVIQGSTDTITPASLTLEDFNLTCTTYPDVSAHARIYPNMGHGQVLEAARGDVAAWIEDRFSDVPVASGCVLEDVEPVSDSYSQSDLFWEANIVSF